MATEIAATAAAARFAAHRRAPRADSLPRICADLARSHIGFAALTTNRPLRPTSSEFGVALPAASLSPNRSARAALRLFVHEEQWRQRCTTEEERP